MGTRNLNKVLQELINPLSGSKASIVYGGVTWRVGDRRIRVPPSASRDSKSQRL